jgi:hypothetical protein
MSDNSIESETRGGFHASFGRGNPCTLLRKKDAGSALSELSGMHALDAESYLARYFTGEAADRDAVGR